MDKRLRLRRGVEQKHTKVNPRLRLTREEEMKGMATKVRVAPLTVEIDGTPQDGFTVNKYLIVQPGDVVTFDNGTAGEAFIQFQLDTIFGPDPLRVQAAGKEHGMLKRPVSETAPIGSFAFAVFCMAGPRFAVAQSTPIIIINPKDDR